MAERRDRRMRDDLISTGIVAAVYYWLITRGWTTKIILLALLLIIILSLVSNCNALFGISRASAAPDETGIPKNETYIWPEYGLAAMLPEPQSINGHISNNKETLFSINVYNVSQNQFFEYVSDCKEVGFIFDTHEDDSTFYAEDNEMYDLSVHYDSEDEEMSVDLRKGFDEIKWPDSDVAKLLPIPQSTFGKIGWEQEDGFVIYVGNTSKDEFDAYVDACKKAGFKEDYDSGSDYYYADSKNGYHLSLNYENNNIMFIKIDKK